MKIFLPQAAFRAVKTGRADRHGLQPKILLFLIMFSECLPFGTV
jgi:hypothetical protein